MLILPYRISSQILNNYYEAFEKYFTGRMLWDFTINNSYKNGDLWNKEDFSVLGPKNGYGPVDEQNNLQYALGPDGQAKYPIRGALGFERPTPLVLSGKPVETHFYGPYHFFDPKKGEMNPVGEFHLSFESKETDAPTEIYVPKVQYQSGFYVWLSDGWAYWEDSTQRLYFYPVADDPGWIHEVTIRAPLVTTVNGQQRGEPMKGWSYFIDGQGRVLVGKRQ